MTHTHYWHSIDGCLMRSTDVPKHKSERASILLKASMTRFFSGLVTPNSAVSILAATGFISLTQVYA